MQASSIDQCLRDGTRALGCPRSYAPANRALQTGDDKPAPGMRDDRFDLG